MMTSSGGLVLYLFQNSSFCVNAEQGLVLALWRRAEVTCWTSMNFDFTWKLTPWPNDFPSRSKGPGKKNGHEIANMIMRVSALKPHCHDKPPTFPLDGKENEMKLWQHAKRWVRHTQTPPLLLVTKLLGPSGPSLVVPFRMIIGFFARSYKNNVKNAQFWREWGAMIMEQHFSTNQKNGEKKKAGPPVPFIFSFWRSPSHFFCRYGPVLWRENKKRERTVMMRMILEVYFFFLPFWLLLGWCSILIASGNIIT